MKRPATALLLLAGLAAAMSLSSSGSARAQEAEPEVTLPACGIRYPGGYDPNTVGVVEGRVTSFNHPAQGPVTFLLETPAETYTVLAAPAWYWDDRKIQVRDADRVRVKGSKSMGTDGNLYLVAQEIAAAGADNPLVLRTPGGKPLWSGCGPAGCSKHRP